LQACTDLLYQQIISIGCLYSVNQKAFAVAGPRLWDSLRLELKEITSLNVFKACVKNDFLSLAFERLG